MILRQLIQTARRFCECRSQDFVPDSEDLIVVIAYSIHDQFLARSFDIGMLDLAETIKGWLEACEAVAYILVHRNPKNCQEELPSPIGRVRMDRVTISAATADSFQVSTFLLQEHPALGQYKLIETNLRESVRECAARNLLRAQQNARREESPSFFSAVSELRRA